jgi:hypothetical protein
MKSFLWFTAGAAIGSLATYKYMGKIFKETLDGEVAELTAHFRKKIDKQIEDLGDAEEMAKKLIREAGSIQAAEALTNYQGGSTPAPKPTPKRPVIDPEAKPPYIISFDAYDSTEVGYEQFSLTWFEGDEVMVDFADEIVSAERVEQTIGADNLTKFGKDGNDENVIYVRCEKFNMDFEVTRSAGKYSVEVLGEGE